MKVEARRLIDQVLAKDEPCLAAVFCTYTFDPAYFEDHVLRALLRLGGDPDEDGARYLEEARAALCETPVTCFADASVRQAGRRLPYDLHLIRKRTFHPKVFLVLYPDEARLAVGSGNVTRPGLENNAELFFTRTLRYDEPVDAAMLRAVDGFLASCAELAPGGGTQLEQLRSQLASRIAATPAPGPRAAIDAVFVHSFRGAGLSWLADAVPPEAKVERIGVLAPYFERDDLDVGDEHDGLRSVLNELLAMRPGSKPAIDIGVPWDDPPLQAPTTGATPALQAGPGLWACRWSEETKDGKEKVARIGYPIMEKATAQRVETREGSERVQRHDRADVERAIADRNLWPVPPPVVHAPAHILRRIDAEHTLTLWLHPALTLTPAGRPVARQLHAKLFLITATVRGSTSTYALVGSANASRAALARNVAEGGNVEAGVIIRLDGEVKLADVLPSLVSLGLDQLRLEERSAPATEVDLSAWIEEAIHHADARTLTVVWAADGPAPLGRWALRYQDRALAHGDGPASAHLVVGDFDLAASCAELELTAGAGRWSVPIRVADLTLLPTRSSDSQLDLRALLAILGRRVGSERLATVRAQRGPAGVATVLEALFGDGFSPTDVFKAWWGLREDLSTAPTVASFRNRLCGLTGVKAVWLQLRAVPDGDLTRDEVWVYGSELCRELARVDHPAGPDRPQRVALLAEVVASIRDDLRSLEPPGGDVPWLAAVHRFYQTAEDAS